MVSFGHERDAYGARTRRLKPEGGEPAAKISNTVTNFIRRLEKNEKHNEEAALHDSGHHAADLRCARVRYGG